MEILSHITAPSRGFDDARYRALAQAYLDFEFAERRNLDDESLENEDMEADIQLQQELRHSTQDERSSQASYRPEEERRSASLSSISSLHMSIDGMLELGLLNSPILSFNSVLDNSHSPGLQNCISFRNPAEGQSRVQDPQEPWIPSPSIVSDSQPEADRPAAARPSPSHVWEVLLKRMNKAEEQSSASNEMEIDVQQKRDLLSANLGTASSTPLIVASKASSEAEIPSSPSPVRDSKSRCQRLLSKPDKQVSSIQMHAEVSKRKRLNIDETVLQTSSLPSAGPIVKTLIGLSNAGQTPKRQRVEGSREETSQTRNIPSSKTTEVATPSPANVSSVWVNKLEIRPPPPQTSTKSLTPESLVTPSLLNLSKKMPIPVLYKPYEQKRDMRSMERGYWRVYCGNWDARLRIRCWGCLGNFVGKSLAGWGVWCVRDEKFESIRVYCWGITVTHIYLLLYMASEGKVKKSAPTWIGGDGQIIIVMPS